MNTRIARLDGLLLATVDACLAGVILAVPLALGGRIALGQLILVGLVVAAAVAWCLRQSLGAGAGWFHSAGELLLMGALAWAGLQITPLPAWFIERLSPQVYRILPLWTPGADGATGLGLWNTLSLSPGATRHCFVMLLAFAILFLVVVQRVRHVEDVERLLRWLALATLVMAIFGVVQYVTTNGKFYWIFEHPYTTTRDNVKGAFTNRNHFAQFMALGIGPLVWWIYDGLRRHPAGGRTAFVRQNVGHRQTVVGLRTIALGFVVFAGLMSLSRGGAMAMFSAAAVLMLVLYRTRLAGWRLLAGIGGAGVLAVACLFVYGYEAVARRLDDFSSLERLDVHHARRRLWQADLAAAAQYPWIGAGLGSHSDVYPMYLPDSETTHSFEFTHAESGYVQVCMEAGVPGLLMVLATAAMCGYWCLSAGRRRPPGPTSTRTALVLAAISASLVASFVHALGDYIWYVPGCMIAPVVLAACACRLSGLGGNHETRYAAAGVAGSARLAWLAGAATLGLIGGMAVQDRLAATRAEPAWHRYLMLSQKSRSLEKAARAAALKSMAEELDEVLRWRPDHPQAHARMASVQLQLFDAVAEGPAVPMDARQVREAALANAPHFPSSEAMHAWLSRAFGTRLEHLKAALRHTCQALALCPLEGKIYLYLGDLSYLDGRHLPDKAACVTQALRVRPFDGGVLFAAGQEAVLAGDFDVALRHWRGSFQAGSLYQEMILDLLVGQAPAAFLLETFQPDLPALRRMVGRYVNHNQPDERRLVLQRFAESCASEARQQQGLSAARTWMECAEAYGKLDQPDARLECLRAAVQCDSSLYDARHQLGAMLCQRKQFAEAESHLTWCLQRQPQDRAVRKLLEEAVEGRLRITGRSRPQA